MLDKRTRAYRIAKATKEQYPNFDSEFIEVLAFMLGELTKKTKMDISPEQLDVEPAAVLEAFNLSYDNIAPNFRGMLVKAISDSGVQPEDIDKLATFVEGGGINWYAENDVPFTTARLCKRLPDFLEQARNQRPTRKDNLSGKFR